MSDIVLVREDVGTDITEVEIRYEVRKNLSVKFLCPQN